MKAKMTENQWFEVSKFLSDADFDAVEAACARYTPWENAPADSLALIEVELSDEKGYREAVRKAVADNPLALDTLGVVDPSEFE